MFLFFLPNQRLAKMDPFAFPHLENHDDSDVESDSDAENGTPRGKRNGGDSPVKPTRSESDDDTGDTEKYGYEDAAPTTSIKHDYDGTRVPRRSSIRPEGAPRRSSIGCSSAKSIEVRVRGERFPVVRRRSIDFARSVRVKEVTPVVKLNQNEEELWLNGEDFKQMKEERKKTVKSVMKGNTEADIRGLEKYIDKSIRQAKQVAWDTVLIEQDEQELAGHFSAEKLAEVYKHYTRESPIKAAMKAKEDNKAVQDYVNTPRTQRLMMRRLSC